MEKVQNKNNLKRNKDLWPNTSFNYLIKMKRKFQSKDKKCQIHITREEKVKKDQRLKAKFILNQ